MGRILWSYQAYKLVLGIWHTQSAGIESSGSSISAGGFTGGVNESKSVPWFTFTNSGQKLENMNAFLYLAHQCVVNGHFKGVVWSYNKSQQVSLRKYHSKSDLSIL